MHTTPANSRSAYTPALSGSSICSGARWLIRVFKTPASRERTVAVSFMERIIFGTCVTIHAEASKLQKKNLHRGHAVRKHIQMHNILSMHSSLASRRRLVRHLSKNCKLVERALQPRLSCPESRIWSRHLAMHVSIHWQLRVRDAARPVDRMRKKCFSGPNARMARSQASTNI
eukprot:INCI4996.9.p1 GENE.INCI4996.9~~INCI4996.9.p1  ORF type:complete len:173 (-),score=17.28 INCI4996.9:11-529(-)